LSSCKKRRFQALGDTNAEAASTRRWFSLKRFITKQIVWTLPSISITSR